MCNFMAHVQLTQLTKPPLCFAKAPLCFARQATDWSSKQIPPRESSRMLSAFIVQAARNRLHPTATLALAQCRSLSALPCPDPTHTAESLPERSLHSSGRCADVPQSQNVQQWRESLPSVDEFRERLHSHQGASCSTSEAQATLSQQPVQPELHWRQIAAASQQALSGSQMLTDTFGRRHSYLRISLTEKCNLRCLYCMPAEGVDLTPKDHVLTTEEIVQLAALFVGAGVDKIRLTGGEPTLRKDLVPLVQRLHALPGAPQIGLTSNGIALKRSLPALQAAGLTLLNVSLDTLQPARFEAMTRRPGLQRVLDSLQLALDLGFAPVKVNVVVMRGQNEDEIGDFVELTRHRALNVRFIEYMPFDGNVWSNEKLVPFRAMQQAVQAAFPQGLERQQDPHGEVAKNFRVKGFKGTVSFVTSMTQAFCADCNRLRLMADGNLKVCLFGANEVSLRDALRQGATGEELRAIVSAAVDRKKAAHAGMFELAKGKNRAMVKIGG